MSDDEHESTAVIEHVAVEDKPLLSRKGVAKVLNVTYSRVRYMHERGVLQGTQDDSGVWRFDPQYIEQFKHSLDAIHVQQDEPEQPGDQAARAFEMFEQGRSLIDVVIELELPPAVAMKLITDYAQMSDHIVITERNVLDEAAASMGWEIPWDDSEQAACFLAALFRARNVWDWTGPMRQHDGLPPLIVEPE